MQKLKRGFVHMGGQISAVHVVEELGEGDRVGHRHDCVVLVCVCVFVEVGGGDEMG